jgi:predicted trehalose synthase
MATKQTSMRFSEATKAQLDALAKIYGDNTKAAAEAIAKLHAASFGPWNTPRFDTEGRLLDAQGQPIEPREESE